MCLLQRESTHTSKHVRQNEYIQVTSFDCQTNLPLGRPMVETAAAELFGYPSFYNFFPTLLLQDLL